MTKGYSIKDVIGGGYLDFNLSELIDANNEPRQDGLFNDYVHNARYVMQLNNARNASVAVNEIITKAYHNNPSAGDYDNFSKKVIKSLLNKSVNACLDINDAKISPVSLEGVMYDFNKEDLVHFSAFFMKIEGLMKYVYATKKGVHSRLDKSLIFSRIIDNVHQENGRTYYRKLRMLKAASELGTGVLSDKIFMFYKLITQAPDLMHQGSDEESLIPANMKLISDEDYETLNKLKEEVIELDKANKRIKELEENLSEIETYAKDVEANSNRVYGKLGELTKKGGSKK